uniref:ALK and LTK ligand 1 n=1 Tax=Anolis carolinensis TaxID=28377 RepID=A0A803TAY1_ANOCA
MPGDKAGPLRTRRRRPRALPALLLLLLLASGRTEAGPAGGGGRGGGGRGGGGGGKGRNRDSPLPSVDRKTLLELLLKALAERDSSLPQAPPPPLGAERVIARRYTSSAGALHAAEPAFSSSSSSSSSRERGPGQAPRLFSSPRHSEVFPREPNLKDKFIKHFTGRVTFSAECSKHFHRLYHNTRDCSTPAYVPAKTELWFAEKVP